MKPRSGMIILVLGLRPFITRSIRENDGKPSQGTTCISLLAPSLPSCARLLKHPQICTLQGAKFSEMPSLGDKYDMKYKAWWS